MAWKTPGVYFTEIDNTDYTNPAASISTTVAIIGFAKKGPIGVPTEIRTYNDYKSIFGTPIKGQYAGLAVRSVLSAGGVVLYTRIADTTLASKSNVIIKNGTEAINGALIINKSSNIVQGTDGYDLGETYAAKLSYGNKNKTLIVRTPASGSLTLSNLQKQLENSLSETHARHEFKINNANHEAFIKSFSIDIGDQNYGPYFVSVGKNDTTSWLTTNFGEGEAVDTDKKYSIKKGSSAYCMVKVNETELQVITNNKNNFILRLGITTVDAEEKFNSYAISFETSANTISLDDIIAKINEIEELNGSIYVEKMTKDSDNFITFISRNDEIKKISVDLDDSNSLTPYLSSNTQNFVVYNGETKKVVKTSTPPTGDKLNNYSDGDIVAVTADNQTTYYERNSEAELGLEDISSNIKIPNFIVKTGDVHSVEINKNQPPVDIIYDNARNLIIFETNAEEGNTLSTIEIKQSELKYDNNNTVEAAYLFDDTDGIAKQVAKVDGEKEFDLAKIAKNNNTGKIEITTINADDVLQPCNISFDVIGKITTNNDDTTGYKDLSDLIGVITSESDVGSNDPAIIKRFGSPAVSDSNKDMIVFTAKEYGEETNIGFRVYTSTSPIDGTKTHTIETVVGNMVKETWEDVSYNIEDANYFKTLINDTPENGGSSYMKVNVIKNDSTSTEVELPDTSELTGSVDTPIYIGEAISTSSINRADVKDEVTGKVISETSYTKYDYMIGDNGVPDDSTDLFTEAMDTETSGLSNKDLYYWHILITPDNISEEVQDCAIKFCEFMDDAIYIVDPPQGISRKNVVKWHNGAFGRSSAIQSDFACTYWPWLKVYDTNESKYVWCMPSVLMAAQFCKVDKNYAPWYAPAGETNGLISQAVDLEFYPNKADRDEMYLDQNRVNPFLMMKNGNILAYGEKTLKRKNSTLTKIHTRRMLISLKHKLRNSIRGFIFMPTVAENISKIRGIATSIMEEAKVGGGVSSYRVVCDGTNNTTETLQQDILNVDISCVPNGCIEQVNISFSLNKSES